MQTIRNLGAAGSVVNARNGSTTTADSNDAKFLDHPGDNNGSYVYLPGLGSNFMATNDFAAANITGDIDLRAYVALEDWTPAAIQTLICKYFGAGSRQYLFRVSTLGRLLFTSSPDGTATQGATSTVSVPAANGEAIWVRATLLANNGLGSRVVTFFTSRDGINWTQLGTPITTVGVASIFAGTGNSVVVGALAPDSANAGVELLSGNVYRAQILNGIDGTIVYDLDTSRILSGAATSFTAISGQSVGINRAATGRKSVAVVSPVWLFGTNDYFEVPYNNVFDFNATTNYTLVAVFRKWANDGTTPLISHRQASSISQPGYVVFTLSNGTVMTSIADGVTPAQPTVPLATRGTLEVVTTVRNGDSYNSESLTSASLTTASLGSTRNQFPLRIGRYAGGSVYADAEIIAVAIFDKALTDTEIDLLQAYYTERLS